MRGSLVSGLLAAVLFTPSATALGASPEPPQSGCGDCGPRYSDCVPRGQKIIVEQPPVEVVFQQAPAVVSEEKCGCLRRLFCAPRTPCCRTIAPTYTYVAPPVQTYALTAPVTQSYGLTTPAVQSFALTAAPAQSFALAAAPAQSFALTAPLAQSFALTAPSAQSFALSVPSSQSFALVAPTSDVTLAGAQALTLQPNLLGSQALQNLAQQALSAYAEKLRAGQAQAEAAKAEATTGDCCKKLDALLAEVKELHNAVITQGTTLINHEKRIQALEKK